MNAYQKRRLARKLKEQSRRSTDQDYKRMQDESVIRRFENAYKALHKRQPAVTYRKGFFLVRGMGRLTRSKMLQQANIMESQVLMQEECGG